MFTLENNQALAKLQKQLKSPAYRANKQRIEDYNRRVQRVKSQLAQVESQVERKQSILKGLLAISEPSLEQETLQVNIICEIDRLAAVKQKALSDLQRLSFSRPSELYS